MSANQNEAERSSGESASGFTGIQSSSGVEAGPTEIVKGREVSPHFDNAIVAELAKIALQSDSQSSLDPVPSNNAMEKTADDSSAAAAAVGKTTASGTVLDATAPEPRQEVPRVPGTTSEPALQVAQDGKQQVQPDKTAPAPVHRNLDVSGGDASNLVTENESNTPAPERSRPSSPFIKYGRDVGVIEETNNAYLVHDRRNSMSDVEHTNPTFNSAWADLPYIEPRPERRRTRQDMEQGRGPSNTLYATALDIRRLSFGWKTTPIKDMSFTHFIDTVKQDEASDILRFREFSQLNRATALEAWSQLVENRIWWEIPSGIKCDRTFARDVKECYYVDAMQTFISDAEEPHFRNLPLVHDELLRRWWNQFRHRGDFMYEEYCRVSHGLFIPYDSFETAHLSPEELQKLFPQVPVWFKELQLPAGVPVPLPLCVWYFHKEMAQVRPGSDQTIERRRWDRLWEMLKIEYLSLFAAMWYSEARWGGRFFLLSTAIIEDIARTCSGVIIASGLTADEIVGIMRTGLNADRSLHCSLVSTLPEIKTCTYVECKKEPSCAIDICAPGRLTTVAETRSRRLRLVIRQSRRLEVRESSPLPLKLWAEDLDLVPGLKDYIVSQRWDAYGRMTVKEVLQSLYDAVRYSSRTIGDLTRQLQDAVRAKAEMEDRMEYHGMTPPSQRRRIDGRGAYDTRWQYHDRGQDVGSAQYGRRDQYVQQDPYEERDPYQRDPYDQTEPYAQTDRYVQPDPYSRRNSYGGRNGYNNHQYN